MDPGLVNLINLDLTWNIVKKRSMTRCPRKPGAGSLKSGNKMHDSTDFETDKSGVAQHFAEKGAYVPIKKRRCLRQSLSPRPRTPSLDDEAALLPQPRTPSPRHEESEQLIQTQHDGLRNSKLLKLTKKEASDVDDFSGIELLAAAACDGSIYENVNHVERSVLVEEHTTPAVESDAVGVKETIISTVSESSSVQDSPFVTDDVGEKRLTPLEGGRLHWDLNTVMDEWEEPCDFRVDGPSEDDHNEGSLKLNEEGYDTGNSDVTGGKRGNTLDMVTRNQMILNSKSTFVAWNGPIAEANMKDKAQEGHDSLLEDGEVREPSVFAWDNEYENIYDDDFRRPNHLLGYKASVHRLQEQSDCVGLEEHDGGGSGRFYPGRKNVHEESRAAPKWGSFRIDGVGRNGAYIRRSRSDGIGVSYSRAERDRATSDSIGVSYSQAERDRVSYEDRRRSHVRSRPVGSSVQTWNSRSNRPERLMRGIDTRPGGSSSNLDDNRSRNHGIYTTVFNRNDRGTPPGLSRGGSGFHKDSQEECHGPEPCYIERKPRSRSPRPRRGSRQTRLRSRSRSESPIAWHFPQGGRNVGKPKCMGFVSPTRSSSVGEKQRFSFEYRERSKLNDFGHRSRSRSHAYTTNGVGDHRYKDKSKKKYERLS